MPEFITKNKRLIIILLIAIAIITSGWLLLSPYISFYSLKNSADIDEYQHFLDKYPNSPYTEQVKEQMSQLAFRKALEKNTVDAYNRYISTYPKSEKVKRAKEIRNLLAFIKALNINKMETYQQFIRDYPDASQMERIMHLRQLLDTIKTDVAFKKRQLRAENAQIAYREKEDTVKRLVEDKDIDYETLEVLIRVIKSEETLEVWAKDRKYNARFQLIKQYPVCIDVNLRVGDSLRGTDLLIPESFYHIAHFYPFNPYLLRLEINFPNQSDKIRGRTGGDIAIHGGCYSTYCTPLTDENIKEVYIFAVEAKSKGQEKIPVHNYPARLDDEVFNELINKKKYAEDSVRVALWKNMKEYWDYFESTRQLCPFRVDKNGKYVFEKPKNEKKTSH